MDKRDVQFAAIGLVVTLPLIVLSMQQPLIGAGVAGLVACLAFPKYIGLIGLYGIAAVAPVLNPAIAGSGIEGRVYLSAAFAGMVAASAIGMIVTQRGRLPRYTPAALCAIALYAAIMLQPGAEGSAAWLYRPLQAVILAAAVWTFMQGDQSRARRVFKTLVLFGGLGAWLGVIHAVVPAIDPFVFSRPADLPFESTVGAYVRATGAFTYPNVFGMFCVYLTLAAVAGRINGYLGRNAATFAILGGILGTLASASRASLGGLVVGFVVLVWLTDKKRRVRRLVVAFVLGIAVLFAVSQTTVGATVLSDRIADAGGQSLLFRQLNTARGFETFYEHPIFGTGIAESRLDNGVLLYLSMAGVIGFLALLVAYYFMARTQQPKGTRNLIPAGSAAMLAALLSSSLLQDSLGQTLSSSFLGVAVGLLGVLGSPAQEVAEVEPQAVATRR